MASERRISLKEAIEHDGARSGKCFYCGRTSTRLEYDHFPIPRAFGGVEMVPSCLDCHDLKDRIDLLDWPKDALAEAFEGLTPMAALLVAKCLTLGLRANAR